MNRLNQNSIKNFETTDLKKYNYNKWFIITALSLASLFASPQETKSQNIITERQKIELKWLTKENNLEEDNLKENNTIEIYDETETNDSRINEIVEIFKENQGYGIPYKQLAIYLKKSDFWNVINQQIPDWLNYSFSTYELVDYIIEAKDRNGRIITEDEWNKYRWAVCHSEDWNVRISDSCFCLANDACPLPIVFDVKFEDLENNSYIPSENDILLNKISKEQTKALFETSQDFRDFYLNPNYHKEDLSSEELDTIML